MNIGDIFNMVRSLIAGRDRESATQQPPKVASDTSRAQQQQPRQQTPRQTGSQDPRIDRMAAQIAALDGKFQSFASIVTQEVAQLSNRIESKQAADRDGFIGDLTRVVDEAGSGSGGGGASVTGDGWTVERPEDVIDDATQCEMFQNRYVELSHKLQYRVRPIVFNVATSTVSFGIFLDEEDTGNAGAWVTYAIADVADLTP